MLANEIHLIYVSIVFLPVLEKQAYRADEQAQRHRHQHHLLRPDVSPRDRDLRRRLRHHGGHRVEVVEPPVVVHVPHDVLHAAAVVVVEGRGGVAAEGVQVDHVVIGVDPVGGSGSLAAFLVFSSWQRLFGRGDHRIEHIPLASLGFHRRLFGSHQSKNIKFLSFCASKQSCLCPRWSCLKKRE